MTTQAKDVSVPASLTVDIVAGYVANNQVPHDALGGLVLSVHAALKACGGVSQAIPEAPVVKLTPAQVRRSIQGEHLISFEDGRPYKALKRHLTALGMTPDEYRAKWSLPADYPMVSPEYSRRRSELAKSMGLGLKGRGARRRAR